MGRYIRLGLVFVLLILGLVGGTLGWYDECREEVVILGTTAQKVEVCNPAELTDVRVVAGILLLAALLWPDLSKLTVGVLTLERRVEAQGDRQESLSTDVGKQRERQGELETGLTDLKVEFGHLEQSVDVSQRTSVAANPIQIVQIGGAVLGSLQLEELAARGDEQQRKTAIASARQLREVSQSSEVLEGERPADVAPGARKRRVFDAANRSAREIIRPAIGDVSPRLARDEGDPATGDAAVDEVYDNLRVVLDLFAREFNRNSFDGRGSNIEAIVHVGEAFANGFWSGGKMIIGDGDGRVFRRPTSVDLIGTFFGAAVLESNGVWVYLGQSGSLHTSIGDVFGSLSMQYQLNQDAAEADWLIGSDLLMESGQALRSLADPGSAYDNTSMGKDAQAKHMSGFVETSMDNGGAHLNSGIPSHAFYATAMRLGGRAWERAGRIWYQALGDPFLGREPDFRSFASATFRAAAELYTPSGDEVAAVTEGWQKVGVLTGTDDPMARGGNDGGT